MKYTHHSEYFYGNKISDYGLEHGYIDYRTFAKAFDAVLNNEIMSVLGYEFEQISGFVDHTDEIEELEDEIAEWIDEITTDSNPEEDRIAVENIAELKERIEELREEEDNPPDVFQYYIVSASGAELIQECEVGLLWYSDNLDMYIWGITHYGTSWDYVLTDIEIVFED